MSEDSIRETPVNKIWSEKPRGLSAHKARLAVREGQWDGRASKWPIGGASLQRAARCGNNGLCWTHAGQAWARRLTEQSAKGRGSVRLLQWRAVGSRLVAPGAALFPRFLSSCTFLEMLVKPHKELANVLVGIASNN